MKKSVILISDFFVYCFTKQLENTKVSLYNKISFHISTRIVDDSLKYFTFGLCPKYPKDNTVNSAYSEYSI